MSPEPGPAPGGVASNDELASSCGPAAVDPGRHAPTVPFAEVRERAVRTIAHAIRTPLSLVAAPLELLDAATRLGDRERRHLAIARDSVARVRDEFEHLAAVARWPSVLRPVPTDVASLVHGVVAPLQSRLPDRTLALDVQLTAAWVVDHDTVAWALQVLVADLATSAEPGSRIEVATTADGGTVAVLARIAGPAAPAAQDVEDRTGPLTTVACDVVTTQGGSVGRSPGQVELRLPVVGAPARVASPPPSPGPAQGDGRDLGPLANPGHARAHEPERVPDDAPVVLLVEDDDQLRALLEAVLGEDHQVEAVATAEEALARVRRVPPDLVVCDVVLPGASGEELVEALGHQPDLADVPVVMLTGRTDEDLRVRLLRHGADDFLTKPFAVAELRARMANLAGKHRDASRLRDRLEDTRRLSEQLQRALDSRVVIEQAKAFVAADRGIGVEEAFDVLRDWARAHERRLHDVARAVVETDFRP